MYWLKIRNLHQQIKLKFDYNDIDLPVKDVIPQIQKELSSSNTLIVKAPPGAGKSTLLHLLGGLDTPTSGEVWLHGQLLNSMNENIELDYVEKHDSPTVLKTRYIELL